jgi:hypothetical protein
MQKKTFSILVSIAVFIVAAVVGQQFGKEFIKVVFPPTQQQLDEKLLEGFTTTAAKINAKAPTMMDRETRLDKAVAGPGARLTYFYSLPNYSSHDLDRNVLFTNIKSGVKKAVCDSEEMKPSLQDGGVYVYAYAGNDGMEMVRFELSKHDCGF